MVLLCVLFWCALNICSFEGGGLFFCVYMHICFMFRVLVFASRGLFSFGTNHCYCYCCCVIHLIAVSMSDGWCVCFCMVACVLLFMSIAFTCFGTGVGVGGMGGHVLVVFLCWSLCVAGHAARCKCFRKQNRLIDWKCQWRSECVAHVRSMLWYMATVIPTCTCQSTELRRD